MLNFFTTVYFRYGSIFLTQKHQKILISLTIFLAEKPGKNEFFSAHAVVTN